MNFLKSQPAAVFCDFDGTITQIDGTDAILERFALPDWRQWELQWNQGKISSQTCLSRQVELLKVNSEELLHFAASLPIDEGIFALEQNCRAYKIPLTILSDGLDLVIRAVLRRHGLLHLPVLANRLHLNQGGAPTLSYPYAKKDCERGAGNCKCAHAKPLGRTSAPTIYIGDGMSDFCVARRVDSVYAKAQLRRWCESEGIPHHPFETLDDVAAHLFPKDVPV